MSEASGAKCQLHPYPPAEPSPPGPPGMPYPGGRPGERRGAEAGELGTVFVSLRGGGGTESPSRILMKPGGRGLSRRPGAQWRAGAADGWRV